MDIKDFIAKIENEIDEISPGTLHPDTEFTAMKEWSSMHALILIAMIDSEYNITINGDDLQKCKTVQDLYNVVKNRL
jgi:acyl carrier protein